MDCCSLWEIRFALMVFSGSFVLFILWLIYVVLFVCLVWFCCFLLFAV